MLTLYFVSFSLIVGGAFALMYVNIMSINKMMDEPRPVRHPEAPEAGEEVMYVDLTRDKLEDLYND